jgi:hypothetical protein
VSDKPSYLGLLNGIALAESRAHRYLEAWIAVTPNPDVKAVLQTVSYREGEHGLAFAKRINELGYQLREKDDPAGAKAMEIAGSDLPDVEKFRKLGLDRLEQDVLGLFDNVFADHSIDIQTGALLGRYIAEEYDTGRRLRACYEALAAGEGGRPAPAGDDRIAALAGQVDALCRAVEDLRQVVGSQATPASNGKAPVPAKRARR